MCGLSHGDSDQNYPDIDFAIYLTSGGAVWVYESGASRGSFGTYKTGDVFRVALEGGVIKYRQNGTVFYTSLVAPTLPLVVDTSLNTPGATLGNVVLNGVFNGTAIAPLVFSVPTGNYATPQNVAITTATAGATIHYTTNDVDPIESDPVLAAGNTVLVNHGLTLKARAWGTGLITSDVSTGVFWFSRPR